jgi:TFIIF-interacting CTD phosphatase-like protein
MQDTVDPSGVFKHRLYQNSCNKVILEEENIDDFVKDLGRLGRDLNRVIYIDCKAFTFWVNPNNGTKFILFSRPGAGFLC